MYFWIDDMNWYEFDRELYEKVLDLSTKRENQLYSQYNKISHNWNKRLKDIDDSSLRRKIEWFHKDISDICAYNLLSKDTNLPDALMLSYQKEINERIEFLIRSINRND